MKKPAHLLHGRPVLWLGFYGALRAFIGPKFQTSNSVRQYGTLRAAGKHPLFSHDLLRIAAKADLELPGDFEEWLDEITAFNLNTRYDNYKQSFKKLCTEEFTGGWIDKIKTIRLWLIERL